MPRRLKPYSQIDWHDKPCQSPLPGQPTNALPGSPEKIQILCERAERREQLFHPLDVRANQSGMRYKLDHPGNGSYVISGLLDEEGHELKRAPVHDRSFGGQLRAAREELGWSQQHLADNAGIGQKRVSVYENGRNLPKLSTAVRLADTLGVSLDRLAGRDRVCACPCPFVGRIPFAHELAALQSDHHLSSKQLAARVGLDENTILAFLSGDRRPSWKAFLALGEFFDVSLDELSGRRPRCRCFARRAIG